MSSREKSDVSNKSNELLMSAGRSTSYNIILQILLRVVTFLTNAFIVHYVSKDVLGVVNVRLTLLYSTTQFLTREAFRRASLSNKSKDSLPLIINMTWLSVPISVICGLALRYVWLNVLSQPDPDTILSYQFGVDSMVLSVALEMLAEPLFVITQLSQFVKLRIVAEGVSLTVRCLFMGVAVVRFPNYGVAAFSCGQLLASSIYCSIYYVYVIKLQYEGQFPVKTFRDLFPAKICNQWFDKELIVLTVSFFKQTIVKQLLTEGERYIMTIFNILSFSEQGIYDIVNNLGSLAARFIFQPIEENSYLFFAQSLNRGQPLEERQEIARVLKNVIKMMVLLGVIILAFGPSFSSQALYLYGGLSLAGGMGPTLLSWHCFYILFLAVNGPTECFVFATVTSQSIESYNKILVYLSVVFLIAAYYLTIALGSVGFILANCLNMAIRIGHSLQYIASYFKSSNPLSGLLLNKWLLVILVLSNQVTWHSGVYLNYSKGLIHLFVHISLGGVCLLWVLMAIYYFEKELVSFVIEFFARKKVD